MSPLQGKVALVTGASSGLGAETVRLLSRQGATVFGIGRDTGRLAEVFQRCRGRRPRRRLSLGQGKGAG